MHFRLFIAGTALAAFVIAGCSSKDAAVTEATAAGQAASSPSAAAAKTEGSAQAARAATATVTAAPAANAAATPPAVTKVSANKATRDELLAAFQAAGIPNASQWVREVMEYRPYPADDPNFGKLRGELAKYNPGPGVVDTIVATLLP
jgi:hypothetical protein